MSERRRVLKLLAEGKITVDEADKWLRAMTTHAHGARAAASQAPSATATSNKRYVRITVHKLSTDGRREEDVNLRVPINLVKSGVRLAGLIPGFPGDEVSAWFRGRGVDLDWSKLDGRAVETMLDELGDRDIRIDSASAQVRIACE